MLSSLLLLAAAFYMFVASISALILLATASREGEKVLLKDIWSPSLLWGWAALKKVTRRA